MNRVVNHMLAWVTGSPTVGCWPEYAWRKHCKSMIESEIVMLEVFLLAGL